eukprot:6459539-Amphidinium_carterae.1
MALPTIGLMLKDLRLKFIRKRSSRTQRLPPVVMRACNSGSWHTHSRTSPSHKLLLSSASGVLHVAGIKHILEIVKEISKTTEPPTRIAKNETKSCIHCLWSKLFEYS